MSNQVDHAPAPVAPRSAPRPEGGVALRARRPVDAAPARAGRSFGVAVVALLVLALAGCGRQTVPTSYTSSVKKSLIEGCTRVTTSDDPRIGTKQQINDYCTCVEKSIVKNVKFADFKKANDALTDKRQVLPKNIQAAYKTCEQPSLTATTTTSAPKKGKTSTTTTAPKGGKASTSTTTPRGATTTTKP